ncbi:MAG: type II toxin-antitoxin system VapC family toxin [Polyangia bacterium]
MSVAVVDTSALVRLYVPDGPLPRDLEAAVESAWRGDGVLMAPELVFVEAAQVLLKKETRGVLTRKETSLIMDAILDLPLEALGHRDLLPGAISLSRDHSLNAYDALFLSAAVNRGASLITADARLRAAFDRLS